MQNGPARGHFLFDRGQPKPEQDIQAVFLSFVGAALEHLSCGCHPDAAPDNNFQDRLGRRGRTGYGRLLVALEDVRSCGNLLRPKPEQPEPPTTSPSRSCPVPVKTQPSHLEW